MVDLCGRGLLRFVRENLPLLLGAGAGAAFLERVGPVELAAALAVLLSAALTLSIWYWLRFRFRLIDGVLEVDKGLLERTRIELSADRVQHVAVEQPASMRPLGLVRVRIDTAGGASAEVELPAVRRSVAERLRDSLGSAAAGESAPAFDVRPTLLFRAGHGALILHGLTGNGVYVAAAGLLPVLGSLERGLRPLWDQAAIGAWLQPLRNAPWLFGAGVALTLFAALLLTAVAITWTRFAGYRLEQRDGRFYQTSGWLQRQEQAITAGRLQVVEWVQTAVGRPLGRGYLVCRQYGGVTNRDDGTGRGFLVPGVSATAAPNLLRCFWPDLGAGEALHPVSRRYRRSVAIRALVPLALPLVGVAVATGEPLWLEATPGVVPLALGLAHLRWRNAGWRLTNGYVRVRRGWLGQRTAVFPLAGVHVVSLQQSWLQRRAGCATLHLIPATGGQAIPWIPLGIARAAANRALSRVESGPA